MHLFKYVKIIYKQKELNLLLPTYILSNSGVILAFVQGGGTQNRKEGFFDKPLLVWVRLERIELLVLIMWIMASVNLILTLIILVNFWMSLTLFEVDVFIENDTTFYL